MEFYIGLYNKNPLGLIRKDPKFRIYKVNLSDRYTVNK